MQTFSRMATIMLFVGTTLLVVKGYATQLPKDEFVSSDGPIGRGEYVLAYSKSLCVAQCRAHLNHCLASARRACPQDTNWVLCQTPVDRANLVEQFSADCREGSARCIDTCLEGLIDPDFSWDQ